MVVVVDFTTVTVGVRFGVHLAFGAVILPNVFKVQLISASNTPIRTTLYGYIYSVTSRSHHENVPVCNTHNLGPVQLPLCILSDFPSFLSESILDSLRAL